MKIQIVWPAENFKSFENEQYFVYLSHVRPCCTKRAGPVFCQHVENQIFITNMVFRWRFIHSAIGSAFILLASLWCPRTTLFNKMHMTTIRVYSLPNNKHPNNIYLKSAKVTIKNSDIVIVVEDLLILLSEIIYQSLPSIFKC